MDYQGNRHDERFIFQRIEWPTLEVIGNYTTFTGGSIERNALTSLKTSGEFSWTDQAPDIVDLLRVSYQFTDDAGETATETLGTFLLGSDTVSTSNNLRSGVAHGYSLLKVLQDEQLGLPMTIPAGTNAVLAVAQLCIARQLQVAYPKDATYSLTSSHTFEPTDTILTVANWLCDAAGCASLYTDELGVVQIQPYIEPTKREPVFTFRDDANSIMLPQVEEQNDWQSSPNVVRLYHESDTRALWAVARNVSGSRCSLSNRGNRETTQTETVDEIADLAALKALAARKVADLATEIEHVSLSHAYVPITTNDAVSIDYAGNTWTGAVQNMKLTLAPSLQCQTQLRRFTSAAIQITTDGGTLWEAESGD